ncbi:Glucose dehydrogenase [acceptor], partial [Stegodyphus mimosarum]
MLHMWGAKSDFDDYWSAKAGPEWNSQGVRRYFQKAENYRRASRAPVPEVRGRRGPMPVTEFDGNSSVLAQAFLRGASSLGIQVGDLNGELEDGAMVSQSNTLNGWRVSAFDAYLDPVMEMSSIHLLTNTIAIKVIIESGRAVGVDTVNLYSGKSYRIRAKKEIILSAGVIGSPHLLLLSGIGPRKHLRDFGIPVISDLPGVGRNLRDHLNVPLYFHIDSPITTTTTKMRSLREVWKYFSKGKGFLAHSGVEAVVRLPSTGDPENGNKLFLMLFNLGSVNEPLFTSIANFKKDAFVETFPDSKNDSKEGFIMLASCTHPVSKGKILLKSVNFLDAPLIDPNYLSETEDVKCLIKAMKMAARLGTTEPLRRLGARLHLPGYSACIAFNQSLDDDRYLECWLRTSGITAYHPVGSCAIGPQDDPMAVLDSKLRLHKVKNLRVVDSSAFPYQTSGNPHAAVLMLAEKAADFILETVKRKQKAQKAAQ